MAIKITKKQEYVDDVAGEVTFNIVDDSKSFMGSGLYGLSVAELLELKEALNNLDIK